MSLSELLERERRRVARLLTVTGTTAMVAAVALLLALGAVALDGARWLSLPRVLPYVVWAGVAVFVALGIRYARRHMSREASLSGIAKEIEEERTYRDGSLRGALEVADSGALGRLRANQLAAGLEQLAEPSLAPVLRRRMRTRALVGSTAAVAGLVVLVAGASAATDGWAALVHPVRAWRGTLLDGVRLENVPKAVLRGERVSLAIRAPGRREVTLAQRSTGAPWRLTRFAVKDDRAVVRLDLVDADLTLYATDGRAISDTAVIKVVERPFIGDVTVRAQFPSYLDRREETINPGEPAKVPQGTVLTFDGQSSSELRDVRLTRDKDVIALVATGRQFMGRMTVASSGRYEWSAIGNAGPIADVPPALELEVLPDSAPRIEILAPGGDTTVTAGDTISVSVLATDDHGLGQVDLRSWIVTAAGKIVPWSGKNVSAQNQTQWAGETDIRTDPLNPGDALHVVVTATDLSPWHHKGESRELVLTLPTLADQREAIRAAADSTVKRATATAAAQKQLQQRTSDASKKKDRDTENSGSAKSGQNPMSYEAAEQAKAFAQEQRQLADRMQQLQKAAKQLEQQLKQAGALDSALQSRLHEAQKLLSEALTPELQEQLKKLEQASQKLSGDDARKALSDLADQQRRLREQLDKSVEMLKRAALEGQMSTLKDDAKDMAKQERQLADSMAKASNQQERSDAQKDAKELADKARELSDEVKQLQQRLRQEKAESGAQRAGEAERKVEESAQALDKAAQQPNPQQRKDGQQQQPGQPQAGQPQSGQQQSGQQQAGQQQGSQQKGQQQGAEKGNQQSGEKGDQKGEAKPGEKGDEKGEPKGDKQGENAARQAANAMEEAANELAKAREQQVSEWKKELTTELDQSIQEMIQLAREQDGLEKKARQGAPADELRSQQSTLQQGVDKSAQRLTEAGQKSSLLTQRSLRMVSDARKKVEEATRQTQTASSSNQVVGAMKDASESLNQAAVSLVRDRERTQEANSASGFAEMLQMLQQMAQQQSSLNSAAQELMPRPGSALDARAQQQSRELARQQRAVAAKLDDVADKDDSGRADELAKEARQIAQALEAAQIDQTMLARQQMLFRKMLDAGKLLEEDQREDTGKREAKAWTGTDVFTPQGTSANGRAASKYANPTWNDLRFLTPEERRLVLEYFKKINGARP